MAQIYIAFVDTPGFFAGVIRRVIKQKYIHVVLSMDAELTEAYSVGRRNPFVPLLAGFEREEREKILQAFPSAEYMVCAIECSSEQRANIKRQLEEDFKKRFHVHYSVLGLPFILWNRPFYQKNHYTCSSYLAKLLEENEIVISKKHFSLVTPKDFYEYRKKRVVFEGSLKELVGNKAAQTAEAAYGHS